MQITQTGTIVALDESSQCLPNRTLPDSLI
jgi:hypothetical protein